MVDRVRGGRLMAAAKWRPAQQPGDVDPLISDAKRKLAGNSYGRAIGQDRSDTYSDEFGAALRVYGANVHAAVLAGQRPGPDVNTVGVFDWAIKRQMKLGAVTVAPPAPPRALAYVWRGTGGEIGVDPVSRICQRLGALVEEINLPWAATMGGLPVGAAGNVRDPSMWVGVQDAVAAFQTDFLARHRVAGDKLRVCLLGYSAGAVVAAICREWLLEHFPQCYVASVSLGDPTRPVGGGFYGRTAPWGDGIADTAYGNPRDYRHAWLTHDKDLYAQIPAGVVGDIMDDVYAEVTRFAFTDLAAVAARMVTTIPKVCEKAGIPLPAVFGSLAGGLPGVLGFAGIALVKALPGLIPLGVPVDELTGTAAAAKAAALGLEFLFAGTGPHIRYEQDPAWPGGPTFVDFAAMHLRDYLTRPAA